MKKWVQRLFTTSTSAKSNPVNSKPSSPENETITDREPIDGTPIWIQRISQGWFLSLKGYKLSPYFKTKEEALKYMWLENHGWNVIANMIIIIHEQVANEAAKEWEKRQAANAKKAFDDLEETVNNITKQVNKGAL